MPARPMRRGSQHEPTRWVPPVSGEGTKPARGRWSQQDDNRREASITFWTNRCVLLWFSDYIT